MTRLIEQYRAWTEKQTRDSLAFRPVSPLERMSTEMSLELTLQGLKISKKYLFTHSAHIFHKVMLDQRLMASAKASPEQDLWKIKFPELPLWIESQGSYIETGTMKAQGFLLTHHYHPEVVKRVKSPVLHDHDMQDMVQKQWKENDWFCDVVGLHGEVVYSFGVNASGDPCITEGHVCPWKQCTFPDVCDQCKAHLVFWGFWTVIALLMIEGNFATSPELSEYPQVTETVRRRIEDRGTKSNPKKKKYVEEQLTYHIINFDACVRKASPGAIPESEREVEQRSSWVQQSLEIDPDSIIYLDKHIAQFQRTLKHPRFVNKQGQTVAVREHEKRIPVKVKELTQRITRVIASRYEGKGE
jgi:hypothetical protein